MGLGRRGIAVPSGSRGGQSVDPLKLPGRLVSPNSSHDGQTHHDLHHLLVQPNLQLGDVVRDLYGTDLTQEYALDHAGLYGSHPAARATVDHTGTHRENICPACQINIAK